MQRIIEQIITGTNYQELQKQLLCKGERLTLQEGPNICRIHETSISHSEQLAEIPDEKCLETDTLKYSYSKWCCSMHSHQKGKCLVWGTITCSTCGRKNHWANVYNNKQENKGRHPQTQIIQKGPKFKPGHRETHGNDQHRHQDRKRSNCVYSVKSCQDDRDEL